MGTSYYVMLCYIDRVMSCHVILYHVMLCIICSYHRTIYHSCHIIIPSYQYHILSGGVTCAALMAILTRWVWIEQYWGAWAFAGFLIGFMLVMCTMDIVESAVVSVFVCLAEG